LTPQLVVFFAGLALIVYAAVGAQGTFLGFTFPSLHWRRAVAVSLLGGALAIFAWFVLDPFQLHPQLNIPGPPPVTASHPTGKLIKVWRVGSPHSGEIPPKTLPADFMKVAADLGYTLDVEVMPAEGFAERFFDSLPTNTEPDI